MTLLGPPGIGKTRLVAELGRTLDADSDLVTWRQGRSPPYGEGITYWALAEIVKAEAGILENDTADRVERRLARMVEHALADEPAAAARVADHLRWLVGDGGNGAVQVRRREEAFAAWRRFLHGLATRRPLVLVLEDLHWADDALLDFLEELLEPAGGGRAAPVPLLVVVTARPELRQRRPGWGGARPGAVTELAPLSEADTGRLLEALLAHHRLPESVGPALLVAAGGNPLFAEEYVRMLRDRNLPAPEPERPAGGGPHLDRVGPELPLPESVHAIIAARLDALPAEEKAALQDLAVLGRVGWVGALTAVSDRDRADVEACLERLHDKEFLYRAGRSSMAGEREYGFRHVLVRDVAYGQIPRAERASKHRRAAAWLESLGPDRVGRRGPELVGRPLLAAGRGGASDASHLACSVHVAIDGLGTPAPVAPTGACTPGARS